MNQQQPATSAAAPKLAQPQQAVVSAKKEAPKDFPGMLKAYLPEIQRALPKHLNGDRMARIALTAFRRNPKLGECDPRSVFAAVIQASQLGLEPDTLGRAFLIPYEKRKNIDGQWKVVSTECQFVPGWKGLVDLMNNSHQGTTWTGAVFTGDDFDYQLGDSPFVKHRPMGEDNSDHITHFYAIGRVKDSQWPIIEVWTADRVRRHRDKYNKVGKKHYSFENWEMYGRKVVLLQVLKYMPASAELAAAIELNDAAEVGAQNLTIKDAIDGTWAPVPDEEPSEPPKEAATPATEVKDKPAADGAPTFEDAIAAVKKGDYDLARDITKNFSDEQKAHIEKSIEHHNSAKGKDKAVFKD